MQTLISTARETLRQPGIDRTWLLDPDNSIRAGTAYIDRQRTSTALDPPKVACAYNAGSLRPNDAPGNRWKMRQFPRDTSQHADRFVAWFNDCFRLFRELGAPAASSFFGRF
jgi:soluble lytic murein transglycosylase-like protein